jgi:hypothetical protein
MTEETRPRPRPISPRCAEWAEVLTARSQKSWDGLVKSKSLTTNEPCSRSIARFAWASTN